jgi:DNA-nicking Smr family endonuclease
MYADHRVRRELQRITSNDPIETAPRHCFDCPSCRAGSPARNLTVSESRSGEARRLHEGYHAVEKLLSLHGMYIIEAEQEIVYTRRRV